MFERFTDRARRVVVLAQEANSEALQVVDRVKPRQTYFTHICHDLPHAATNASLPAGVELAYDGLELAIEIDAWT